MDSKCIFCNEVWETRPPRTFVCSNCGTHTFDFRSFTMFQHLTGKQLANLRGWLYENNNSTISVFDVDRLINLKSPSFHEKADKALRCVEKLTSYAGDKIDVSQVPINSAWCINRGEFFELFRYLMDVSRVEFVNHVNSSSAYVKIKADGWLHLETLEKKVSDSNQCFIAMWFNDEMKNVCNDVIEPGIRAAGYRPHLVNKREHNEKICDEIIAQIRRSKFVLADFTGYRGGVYFEAGFAKGLNLEVIWTCRSDFIKKLHFDIRQYNCIVWNIDDPETFQKNITARIEAVLGRGDYKG